MEEVQRRGEEKKGKQDLKAKVKHSGILQSYTYVDTKEGWTEYANQGF